MLEQEDDIFDASWREVTRHEHHAAQHARFMSLGPGLEDLARPVTDFLPHMELLYRPRSVEGIGGALTDDPALTDDSDFIEYDHAVAAAAASELMEVSKQQRSFEQAAKLASVDSPEASARERALAEEIEKQAVAQAQREYDAATRVQAHARGCAARRPYADREGHDTRVTETRPGDDVKPRRGEEVPAAADDQTSMEGASAPSEEAGQAQSNESHAVPSDQPLQCAAVEPPRMDSSPTNEASCSAAAPSPTADELAQPEDAGDVCSSSAVAPHSPDGDEASACAPAAFDEGGAPPPSVRDLSELGKHYEREAGWALGSGANGAVSTVVDRTTGVTFALKTMSAVTTEGEGADAAATEELLSQVLMQRELSHPNISPVLDVFVDRELGEVAFTMPLCTGGTLVRHLSRRPYLTEADKATLMHKTLGAIAYCHSRGVVHRDLKLDNLLIEDGSEEAELQLIDFGMAVRVPPGADDDECIEDGCSTLVYMAPEMFYTWHAHVAKTGGEVLYGPRVDVWAAGIVAYQLLYGRMPFGLGEDPAEDEEETVDRIIYEPLRFPGDEGGAGEGGASEGGANVGASAPSALARAFCERLLERDPANRPNAREALDDPWLLRASTLHAAQQKSRPPRLPAGEAEGEGEAEAEGGEADGYHAAAEGDDRLPPAPPTDQERERHRELVRALSRFSEADVLHKRAYAALAQPTSADAQRIRELRKAFIEADVDSSGTLSRVEFETVIARFPELACDVDQLFAALEARCGAPGQIEWRWWLGASLKRADSRANVATAPTAREPSAPPSLVDAFLLVDTDGDGAISARDLAAALQEGEEAERGAPDGGEGEATSRSPAEAAMDEAALNVMLQRIAGGAEAGTGEPLKSAEEDASAGPADGQALAELAPARLGFEAFRSLILRTDSDDARLLSTRLQRAMRASPRWRQLAVPLSAVAAFRGAVSSETDKERVGEREVLDGGERH